MTENNSSFPIILLWLAMLVVPMISFAQPPDILVSGTIYEGNSKLEGVKITIQADGSQYDIQRAPGGKFEFHLPYGKDYIVEFSKSKYVTKKIAIKAGNVSMSDVQIGQKYPAWEVTLFKRMEGIDYSDLDDPVGEIFLDPKSGYFDWNAEYTLGILEKIEKVMEEQREQEEAERERQEQINKDYSDAISDGDKALSKEQFAEAAAAYDKAASLKPDAEEVKQKKEKLQLAKETFEKEKAAAATAAELEKKRETYDELVDQGKDALKEEQFDQARAKLTEAKELLPEAEEAPKLLAEVAAAETAKKEAAEKAKLEAAKEEKEAAYAALVSQIDEAKEAGDFPKAQELVKKAMAEFPEKAELKEKEKLILAAKEEQAAKEKAELKEKEAAAKKEKYDGFISQADDAMKNGEYDKAIQLAAEAKKVMPDGKEAAAIAESAEREKKAAAAEAANEAEAEKQAAQQKQFDEFVKQGDDLLKENKFDEAIAAYKKAKEVLPAGNADELIQFAEQKKGKFYDEQQAAKKENQEKEAAAKFKDLIKDGKTALKSGDLDGAEKALIAASALKGADSELQSLMAELSEKKSAKKKAAAEQAKKEEEQKQTDEKTEEKVEDTSAEDEAAAKAEAERIAEEERLAAEKKAEEERLAAEKKAEEERKREEVEALDEKKRQEEEKKKIAAAAALKAQSLKKEEAEKESGSSFSGKVKKARLNEEEEADISAKLDAAANKLVNSTPKAAEIHDLEVGTKEYHSAVAKKYPQGVTEHIYKEGGKVITERIVVKGEEGHIYRFVKHNWGGQYYFKDDKSISQIQWQKETVL